MGATEQPPRPSTAVSKASLVPGRRRATSIRALGVAVLAVLAGCIAGSPVPPNVLLVSIDTLRADRLGCYGAGAAETPAIDGLARDGVRFDKAYSPLPLTLPAHWTLHTGLQPWRHGVVDNGMVLRHPAAPTLAESFSAAGYDTAAFVAAFVLNRTFGLDRGFARYDDGPDGERALELPLHTTAPADERVDSALAWLHQPRDRPFFLWLHLFDPHAPYEPPVGFRSRFSARPYDGEVAFVDTQVARLLAALDRLGANEDTIVVLVSDHGESLGEHGEQTHGVLLYDSTLRVPLIVRSPTSGKGKVRRDPATLADVAPTVRALAGLEPVEGLEGRDLFGGQWTEPRKLAAISESPERRLGWASLIAIRDGNWKYIGGPRPELYRLADDPGERRDLALVEPERRRGLAFDERTVEAQLRTRLAAGDAPSSDGDDETRARIEALGYVTGSRRTSPIGIRPNPVEVIGSLARLDRAYQAFAEGRLRDSEALFLQILEEADIAPGNALEGLARLARVERRNEDAEGFYQRLLDVDPEAVGAVAQLSILSRERGDAAAAVRWARRLVQLAPRDAGAARLLAEALNAAKGGKENSD